MAPKKLTKVPQNQPRIDTFFKPKERRRSNEGCKALGVNLRPSYSADDNDVICLDNFKKTQPSVNQPLITVGDEVVFDGEVVLQTPKVSAPVRESKRKNRRSTSAVGSERKRISPLVKSPLTNFGKNLSVTRKESPVSGYSFVSQKTSTPLDAPMAPRMNASSCKRNLFATTVDSEFTKLKEKPKEAIVLQMPSSCPNNEDSVKSASLSATEKRPELETTRAISPNIQDEDTLDGSELMKLSQKNATSKNDEDVDMSASSQKTESSQKAEDADMASNSLIEPFSSCSSDGTDGQLAHQLKSFSPFKALSSQVDVVTDGKTFQSYKVLSVVRNIKNQSISLQLKSKSGLDYKCNLSGTWFNTIVNVGDVVNIRTENVEGKTLAVDSNEGTIVVKPETLISSTSVTSSFYCPRIAWLNERFYGYGSSNKAMFIGILVHDLFQTACSQKLKTIDELKELVAKTLSSSDTLLSCYANEISLQDLEKEVVEYLPSVTAWLNENLYGGPTVIDGVKLEFVDVADIEDNFWSPNLGLKGKVDLGFTVTIHEGRKPRKAYIPLELKTGRASFSHQHQGQVLLYTMMVDDSEYGPCDSGLLLYLKGNPQMKYVQRNPKLKNALIETRNEIAYFYNDKTVGPPVRDSERACSRCDSLLPCSLMFKSFSGDQHQQYPVMTNRLVPSALHHLTDNHVAFFKKWISLINVESSSGKMDDDEWRDCFWNKSSTKCETEGLGVGKLRIVEAKDLYCKLQRHSSHLSTVPLSDIIRKGERVALSVDGNQDDGNSRVAFTIGFVTEVDSDSVSAKLEKPVNPDYHTSMVRVDKVSSRTKYAVHFSNLLRLMENERTSLRLRERFIDGERIKVYMVNRRIIDKIKDVLLELNETQRRAALTIVASDDVLVRAEDAEKAITTVTATVRIILRMNKRVLITSHNNAALDDVLLKLKDFNVKFLRLGSTAKINSELQPFTEYELTKDFKDDTELAEFYENTSVVATTCLSIKYHPLFDKERFHYCIFLEASKVNFTSALGPLLVSARYALFTDPSVEPNKISEEDMNSDYHKSIFSILDSEQTVEVS